MKTLIILAALVAVSLACRDRFSNCYKYGQRYCKYSYWQVNCARYCKMCTPTTQPPTTASDCQDRYPTCSRYDRKYCKYSYWKTNCKRYCGYCNSQSTQSPRTEPPTTVPECRDKHRSCPSWTKYCSSSGFVRSNCPKMCKVCQGPNTGAPPTNPPTNPPRTNPPVTNPPRTNPPVTNPPRTNPPTNPPKGSCGVPQVPQSRVVGGKTAAAHSWPWQIGLHMNGRFGCGGSIVNSQWVVTAAHCVHRRSASMFTVKLGDHNRNVNEGEQVMRVSKVIVHEGYQNTRLNNDIALLKLEKPAIFGKNVQPVCLPNKGEKPAPGSKCYITGWGKIRHPGGSHYILQQLALTVQEKSRCASKNGKYAPVTDQMLCAANTDVTQNQSGCHGDSGGPFVCQNDNGSWTLHGAVSWGSPRCDIKDAFTVFARVAEFRDWIDRNMQ